MRREGGKKGREGGREGGRVGEREGGAGEEGGLQRSDKMLNERERKEIIYTSTRHQRALFGSPSSSSLQLITHYHFVVL